jgi:hypothetical protein
MANGGITEKVQITAAGDSHSFVSVNAKNCWVCLFIPNLECNALLCLNIATAGSGCIEK